MYIQKTRNIIFTLLRVAKTKIYLRHTKLKYYVYCLCNQKK